MATNKRPPALKSTTPEAPLPGDAIQILLQDVTARQKEVAASFAAANEATSETAGYAAVLAASASAGVTWDALALWVPEDLKAGETPSTSETAIRHLHALADPSSEASVVEDRRNLLQLVADASSEENVLETRRIGNTRVFPLRTDKADADGAYKALESERDAAHKRKDGAREALLATHLAAVNDIAAMIEITRGLASARQAYSRFRARLFVHLVDPVIRSMVPESERGKVYRDVANKAKLAHAAFMKQDGQARSVVGTEGLANHVREAVRSHLARLYDVEEMIPAKSADEKNLQIIGNIFKFVRRAVARRLITKEGATSMLEWLTLPSDATFGNAYVDPNPVKEATGKKASAPRTPSTAAGKRAAAAPKAPKAPTKKAPAPVAPVPQRRQIAATQPAIPKSRATVARAADRADELMADLNS